MPPVMTERKEIDMVLREDPQIDGHDESNFVFTDISTSTNDRVSQSFCTLRPFLCEAGWSVTFASWLASKLALFYERFSSEKTLCQPSPW